MTLQSVVKSISEERLSTYKKSHLSESESESLGLYLWNKRLCSLLLPPLQIIEVSLRNALHDSYIQYCLNKNVKAEEDGEEVQEVDYLWFKTASANIPESERHIAQAERQLTKERKTFIPGNYIAKLPLGFWVAFCDKKFDVNNHTHGFSLWPSLRTAVFPGAVKGTLPLSIDEIGSELRTINSLRNRIAHHETIFNDPKHYHFESALNKVIKAYGRCIKVIKWINPSNLKLISLLENEAKFAELCVKQEIAKYKSLPEELDQTDTSHFDTWESELVVQERLNGDVVVVKPKYCFIKCRESKVVFYCLNACFPKGRPIKVGQQVNFIPQAAKEQGQKPTAQKVRLGHYQ